MKPKPILSNRKLLALTVAVLIVALVLALFSSHHSGKSSGSQNKTAANAIAQPSTLALATISKYLQAREDEMGADQASPTTWLDAVKGITTASWFAQLQPTGSSSTSDVPYNYTLAHQNNYLVKASAANCIWDRDAAQPTITSGVVSCSLYDITYGSNGSVISTSSLPFGWPYNGQQSPAVLKLIEQNGKWLVDNDLTGEGS